MKKIFAVILLFGFSQISMGMARLYSIRYECKFDDVNHEVSGVFEVPAFVIDPGQKLYKYAEDYARSQCEIHNGELVRILTIEGKPVVEKG